MINVSFLSLLEKIKKKMKMLQSPYWLVNNDEHIYFKSYIDSWSLF